MTVMTRYHDGSESRIRLRWQDVNGVVAYKRDLMTIDEICVGFSTPSGDVEIREEMQGWEALIEVLPTHLPGTPSSSDWWKNVAQPPFATNATKLYSR